MEITQEYINARRNFYERAFDQALKFFKPNSESDPRCLYYIARCYECGYHYNKNIALANSYYETVIPQLEKLTQEDDSEAYLILSWYYSPERPNEDPEKSFQLCKHSAMLGNEFALCDLGWKFFHGHGTKINKEAAFKCYNEAANKYNSAKAWCRLGYMYQHSPEPYRNLQKAFECNTKSAELHDAGGCDRLGHMYKYGEGCEINLKKALSLFKESAIRGNSDGQYCLAMMYLEKPGAKWRSKGLYWLESAASLGNNYAQTVLAQLYNKDLDNPEHQEKALLLYKQAALSNKKKAYSGNATAMRWLGYMYEYGEGCEKDYEKAIECYNIAIQTKEIYAIVSLAGMYRYGKGVKVDYEKALELYKTAAAENNAEALLQIGNMYEQGEGVPQSFKSAVSYWEKASELNNAEAMHKLGSAYITGLGVRARDSKKAKSLLSQANQLGYQCSFSLSLINSTSNFIDPLAKNYAESIQNKNLSNKELYSFILDDLRKDFNEYWDYLQPKSKTFLSTGMSVFYNLFTMGEEYYSQIDFSSAISPIMKALESELGKYLFVDYVTYLKDNNIPPTVFSPHQPFVDISPYKKPSYVVNEGKHRLTLGGLPYCFGIKKSQEFKSTKTTKAIDSYLIDYVSYICKKDAFSVQNRRTSISNYLIALSEEVSDIADTLRNKAAHDTIMSVSDATLCVSWLVKVKKLIKIFISKIDFNKIDKEKSL